MNQYRPSEYLLIDMANNCGHDQLTFQERIEWAKHQIATGEIAKNLDTAEAPALLYAGMQAYNDFVNRKPSGYAPSLDATCSGLQILAAITGCTQTAMATNIINNSENKRMDAYTVGYHNLLEILGKDDGKIERKDTKAAIMTSFYGSKAQPVRIFGEGEELRAFFKAMEITFPFPWELNEYWLSAWDSTASEYFWVLPDNFHVHMNVVTKESQTVRFKGGLQEIVTKVIGPKEKGRALSANTTHSIDGFVVREIIRRCSYKHEDVKRVIKSLPFWKPKAERNPKSVVGILSDLYDKSGYLSARVLEYIDVRTINDLSKGAYKELNSLILELPDKPFEVLTVHDCFRALPDYCNDLRKQYNFIMYHLAKSEMLHFITSQVYPSNPIKSLHMFDPKLCLEAEHAIC